jgi:hypothetical protein
LAVASEKELMTLEYMMQKTWGSLSLIVKMGILAGLVGLITPGCSSISLNATQQVTQSENIPNANAPSRDPQVNIGNSANASKVVALQKGMQYKEARKILQQQGWLVNSLTCKTLL